MQVPLQSVNGYVQCVERPLAYEATHADISSLVSRKELTSPVCAYLRNTTLCICACAVRTVQLTSFVSLQLQRYGDSKYPWDILPTVEAGWSDEAMSAVFDG